MLKTEGLMLESMGVGYVGTGCEVEGCVITIDMVGVKGGKAICGIGLRPHKAGEAKGFRGEIGNIIKGVGRDNVREL